jgi:hypothetical protein
MLLRSLSRTREVPQVWRPSEIELSKIHGMPSRLSFSYQRFVQRIGELRPVTFNRSRESRQQKPVGLYACWPETDARRKIAALSLGKCMREELFGLKRELTLRYGLRRHVNELIPSVKFTSSERGEFIP